MSEEKFRKVIARTKRMAIYRRKNDDYCEGFQFAVNAIESLYNRPEPKIKMAEVSQLPISGEKPT